MSLACPRCSKEVSGLQVVEPILIKKLAEAGQAAPPAEVCASCYQELAGATARGSVLMAREKAKEQKKLMLWKSRVNLIKKARQNMNEKMFSDAAVTYEKYIRVLEVVFDAQAGDLTPEHFKDSARTQELTVVASVYWDLIRIYDTSDKYGNRQTQAAKKLAQFLKFTPIFPDIVRKAELFQKSAKNPDVIKSFLKMATETKGRCFIATAAFESPLAPEVLRLCDFRDDVLYRSFLGSLFVKIYYQISPPIAIALDYLPYVKPSVRWILRQIITWIDRASRQ